ncbi:MAG: class I SAM-dependent methyltransferase [Chloroflexi bacterium]|nr:class I SAM-dependent methyltransferase [Chloroflexota bacterium]
MDVKKTAKARAKWDRNSRWYDCMTCLMEGKKAAGWYKKVWDAVKGERVLEVGVGTGRSFPYYPRDIKVTAVDLSDGMLAKAKHHAAEMGLDVDLRQMDVQKLEFPDNSFDTVVTQCTFCSVPDPLLGLQEIRRVLKPGGRAVFLEHMRHDNKVLGKLMDWADAITSWLMGPHINRRTLDNIRKAGLEIETVENLAMGGIMKFIVARKSNVTS